MPAMGSSSWYMISIGDRGISREVRNSAGNYILKQCRGARYAENKLKILSLVSGSRYKNAPNVW